jgi:hypothetical protein
MRATITNAPIARNYGVALTTATTRQSTTIPKGAKEIMMNCTGAFRAQLAPPLIWCGKTTDNERTFTDYTTEATDKSVSTSVTLSSLGVGSTANDYWYVACKYPFAGIWVDVDAANGTTDTMTAYYWNGKWTSAGITDGTNSGGCALAIDGAITWAQSADWQSIYLKDLFPYGDISNLPEAAKADKLYVIRFEIVTTALDSGVTLDEVATLSNPTAWPPGYYAVTTDYSFNINTEEAGCLEFYDAAGSKTLNVTFFFEKIQD